jgi:hypothetical protein
MVSIGKLGKGQQAYYLDSVANGIEDYYAGEGEAPGRWIGPGAATLGLDGEISRDELNAVLSARDPRSGAELPRVLRANRTPGFDVTFSAPKSVSVLWATGDDRVRRRSARPMSARSPRRFPTWSARLASPVSAPAATPRSAGRGSSVRRFVTG